MSETMSDDRRSSATPTDNHESIDNSKQQQPSALMDEEEEYIEVEKLAEIAITDPPKTEALSSDSSDEDGPETPVVEATNDFASV